MALVSSNTSVNESDDFSNITNQYSSSGDRSDHVVLDVVHWLIVCVGLPSTLVAIFGVYSLIKTHHATPVYVINLLISDLIQLCCLSAWKAGKTDDIISFTHDFGIMASIGFMVCISMERYLVIAYPLWYRFRRNIQISVLVCVLVWTFCLGFIFGFCPNVDLYISETLQAVFLLFPFPLFIFFLAGTIGALSTSHSVPIDEKRRIVANLVMVLLIYTVMFLPSIIWILIEESRQSHIFKNIILTLLYSSPLADVTMYIFIRRGVTDRLLRSLCCCKMRGSQQTSSATNDIMLASCSQTV